MHWSKATTDRCTLLPRGAASLLLLHHLHDTTLCLACLTSSCCHVGIYVNDILDAVPIDKYFELFKPAAGGDGGFIRLKLDFARDSQSLPAGDQPGLSACRL
jgi:hypothetical protein